MEQENHNSDEIKNIKTKAVFFIWILPILSLLLLVGITFIGVYYILEQDSNVSPFRIRIFATIVIIVTVLFFIVCVLRYYYSIRYMHIPIWRWMARGFKGKPDLPWIKKSQKPEAKDKNQ